MHLIFLKVFYLLLCMEIRSLVCRLDGRLILVILQCVAGSASEWVRIFNANVNKESAFV
jgi:hypothetical protein